jgi:hypothetical protein
MENQIYSLTTGKYNPYLYSVDNGFINKLVDISVDYANNCKMVQFIQDNIVSKRSSDDVDSIIDMGSLQGFVDSNQTLANEIASYRYDMLKFEYADKKFIDSYKELLIVDYLLSACVCYVEVFDGTCKVQKFFATRNRFIAAGLSGIPATDTTRYISYLTPLQADYELGSLRVLKLSMNKKGGFKIVQPRAGLNFGTCKIKVTPLFLLMTFIKGVTPMLQSNIVKFKYIKDNIVERELTTTLSREIMRQYYQDSELVENIFNRCETRIERGFIRLPELGLSRYDATGVRSLNMSRITSIEVVDSVDARYIDVDFATIMPAFKVALDGVKSLEVLERIYKALNQELVRVMDLDEAKEGLRAFVDSQHTLGTTTFLRFLHDVMMANLDIFKGYTGKPMTYSGYETGLGFDLGVM